MFNFEDDQESIFDELQLQLAKISENLAFEFGPIRDNRREFIISAGGIIQAFPCVISLADRAPRLKYFKVIKFRQRKSLKYSIKVDALTIAPNEILFTLEENNDKVGITLFVKGYKPSQHNEFATIIYLFLDMALGELDVETKVGFIEIKAFNDVSNFEKQPFNKLPAVFDNYFA